MIIEGPHGPFGTTKQVLQEASSETIALVRLEGGERTADSLIIHFVNHRALRIWDNGQSCCERRYMTTNDNLSAFVGAQFLSAEVLPAPEVPHEGDVHEVAFLVVRTSLGAFTIETHNEHNGYYGGFQIAAKWMDAI